MANLLNTDEAAEGSSKELLVSSLIMAPIATFVRRKRDTETGQKKGSIAFASEWLIDTVPAFNDDKKFAPSCLDTGVDEVPREKSSKSCSKRFRAKRENKNLK